MLIHTTFLVAGLVPMLALGCTRATPSKATVADAGGQVMAPVASGEKAGTRTALPRHARAPLVLSSSTCGQHEAKLPTSDLGDRRGLVSWAEPTARRPKGTVLVAEGIQGHLVLLEWDVAGRAEVRRTVLGPPGTEYDVEMRRDGKELHLAVTSRGGDERDIVYYVLDQDMRTLSVRSMGKGSRPEIELSDSIVLLSWQRGEPGPDPTLYIRTFARSPWTLLAARDIPPSEGVTGGPFLLPTGHVVVEFWNRDRARTTHLTAYDARTLDPGSTWSAPESDFNSYAFYEVQAVRDHLLVHEHQRLTELSDALEEVGSHLMAGSDGFVEDPDTGMLSLGLGKVWSNEEAGCCLAGRWTFRVEDGTSRDGRTDPCPYSSAFPGTTLVSHGTAYALRDDTDYAQGKPGAPEHQNLSLVWSDLPRLKHLGDAAP